MGQWFQLGEGAVRESGGLIGQPIHLH